MTGSWYDRLARHGALAHLTATLIAAWPEHETFLEKSISVHDDSALILLDQLAGDIISLSDADEIDLCRGYRWMCNRMIEEELFFRREGRYRCGTVAEATRDVYDQPDIMGHYMRGLLLSQVFWANHAKSYIFFLEEFLSRLPNGCSYIEVGPGHGLYLARTIQSGQCADATALDTSWESLRQTRQCLGQLGVSMPVSEMQLNIQENTPDRHYDAVCISEVLEHLEHPERVMRNLHHVLSDGGFIYVNIPINSPAPDHIYLWRSPEEVSELLKESGFRIVQQQNFPMTGYTLEKAMKRQITVNCAVIATIT